MYDHGPGRYALCDAFCSSDRYGLDSQLLPFTTWQLASESGYRSYNTFRHAFKLQMGQNVREWMGDTAPNCQNQQK